MKKMTVRINKKGEAQHEMSGYSDAQCYEAADRVKSVAGRYIKESGSSITSVGPGCEVEQKEQLLN